MNRKNPCRQVVASVWSTCVFPPNVFLRKHVRSLNWKEIFPLLLLAFTFFNSPSAALAQTPAPPSGTVEDQTGGVIPSAQVTLTDEATKQSRVVESNGTGLFAFP